MTQEAKPKGCPGCSRREAIKIGAAGVLTLMVGNSVACGGALAPLASPITIKISDYAELANDGGVAIISKDKASHSHAIIVKNEGGSYVAMSSECNHFGCEVALQNDKFVCPCHGSEFDLDGKLQQGPASEDLLALSAMADGDNLTIS